MEPYADLVRPRLFRLDAERAHQLARALLRLPVHLPVRGAVTSDPRLATELSGLPLPVPIGVAPGFDKDGLLLPGLMRWGFGYVVVGSVTPHARPGNPRPRLVREPASASLINAMGLPGPGLAATLSRLRRARRRLPDAVVVVNVSGFTPDEVVASARAVQPYASVVELGLFCPNTGEEGEAVAGGEGFAEAVRRVRDVVDDRPLHVKLPAFHDEAGRAEVLGMVDLCLDAGVDGVSVYGVRTVRDPRLALGEGTLSGGAVRGDSLQVLTEVADRVRGRMTIRAAGGIQDGEDAAADLSAGADAVELYTALVYRGPRTARLIAAELADVLECSGRASVRELTGSTGSAGSRGGTG